MLCLVCPVVVGLRCTPWCAGAVACQVFDAIYPGDVSMSKVKWDAKSDHEFIQNYKILQRAFDKRGIDKYIDVEKLVRAKYQDNLEFMQWTKSFFDKVSLKHTPHTRTRTHPGLCPLALPPLHRIASHQYVCC